MSYQDWSSAEVGRQLKSLGYGEYAHIFQSQEILGVHLPLLTEAHLTEMGITSIGHRIRLLRRFAEIASGKTPRPASRTSQKPAPVDEPNPQPKRSEIPRSPPRGTQLKKPDPRYDRSDDSSAESGPSNRSGRIAIKEREEPVGRTTKKPPEKSNAPDILASHKPNQTYVTQQTDDDQRVLCQYCGRKFNPDAAKRHIPVCGRVNQSKAARK
jgi:hypothetical protein